MIELQYPRISISGQCELVGLARSSFYYEPQTEDGYNAYLMGLMDEQYTRTPFYGVRRITAWLRRRGEQVNPKRVRHLMHLMGLAAIYPKRRLSLSRGAHRRQLDAPLNDDRKPHISSLKSPFDVGVFLAKRHEGGMRIDSWTQGRSL